MRGVFACGILDRFVERDFYPFDLCIGVSAGASNVAAYLARMAGRNYRVYTDYSLRPEFMRPWRLVTGGHGMDLDWLWDVTIRDMPVAMESLFSQPCEFLVGVTCAETGCFELLEPTPDNLYDALKASSAMPVAYRDPVTLNGRVWIDGGATNSIPVREAHARGATKIMVLRSRPSGYSGPVTLADKLYHWLLRHRPALASAIRGRHVTYRSNLDFIRNPPSDVQIVEVCPPDEFTVSRSTRDRRALEMGYNDGLEAAETAMGRWYDA